MEVTEAAQISPETLKDFGIWLKGKNNFKSNIVKRYLQCLQQLIRITGASAENVELYLENCRQKQSNTTYTLKQWTVTYITEFWDTLHFLHFGKNLNYCPFNNKSNNLHRIIGPSGISCLSIRIIGLSRICGLSNWMDNRA